MINFNLNQVDKLRNKSTSSIDSMRKFPMSQLDRSSLVDLRQERKNMNLNKMDTNINLQDFEACQTTRVPPRKEKPYIIMSRKKSNKKSPFRKITPLRNPRGNHDYNTQ